MNPQGLKPHVFRRSCLLVHWADSLTPPRCCACPETKRARDDCFLKFDSSEADEKCRQLVQDHVACMRGLGFQL